MTFGFSILLPSNLFFRDGNGEKSFSSLHLQLHHQHEARGVPKGCIAINVGSEGEEQQRFVVPVVYFNHPLFMQLLKAAEEEYGFDQKGTITIPCLVQHFTDVRNLIDRDKSFIIIMSDVLGFEFLLFN